MGTMTSFKMVDGISKILAVHFVLISNINNCKENEIHPF